MMPLRLVVLFSPLLLCSVIIAQEPTPRFKRFDTDKNGKLTKEEFSGPMFDRIDADKDGVITAAEDQAFVRRRRAAGAGQQAAVPASVSVERDLPYAATDNPRQKLDLYLPKTRKGDKPLPVVVFIHGGGWRNGDKSGGAQWLFPLVESGEYVGVSVGYRLSGEAIWPAQIHDCKAAIRWLRANAGKYHLDASKIGITGTSAGGHLVAMLGTSGDVKELEGTLGEHLGQSSRVQCVVDQFGPTDMTALVAEQRLDAAVPRLLGGKVSEHPDQARTASATTYASTDDPPFLFIHGTADQVVPFNQSERLRDALQKVEVDATLIPVEGGAHGKFGGTQAVDRLKEFFGKHLLGKDIEVKTEPMTQLASPQRRN